MREIIAVCRSTKRARPRVARILDQYFWRIGDRTWRGKATNACLDRVTRELRKTATRQTAVSIQEIRSSKESRSSLIRIGNRIAFNDEGLSPIATHPAQFAASRTSPELASSKAIVELAAIFHDLGKASCMFQEKLRRSIGEGHTLAGEVDPVRHEFMSALVWDHVFGSLEDAELIDALAVFDAGMIDAAWGSAKNKAGKVHALPGSDTGFAFSNADHRITSAVGHLILSHHRLSDGSHGTDLLTAGRHVRHDLDLTLNQLDRAPGTPFWHEDWCRFAIHKASAKLIPGCVSRVASVDIGLRSALMLGDHLGSARKAASEIVPEHLANTLDGEAMDSLSRHSQRVHSAAGRAHDMLYMHRDRFPALGHAQVPIDILHPTPGPLRFQWQANAALAAGRLAASGEGGFFGCLFSGTGTGKTRGAPTILSAAAMNDSVSGRRYLRFTLGLGLRVLATQSAREYVDDLGFSEKDVSVVIGQPPVMLDEPAKNTIQHGSESKIDLPDWLRVEMATGGVPLDGEDGEESWMRSLSHDTARHLPAFCEQLLLHTGKKSGSGRRLIEPPITICTVDHLMSVASPARSRHLLGAIRMMTSDLILDEIDQYGPEDIAAVARLVYQTGAAGGRVLVMSATMTPEIALTLRDAYAKGWERYAAETGLRNHVHFLCTGDTAKSCHDTASGADPAEIVRDCIGGVLEHVRDAEPLRRSRILDACDSWEEIVNQIDQSCDELHSDNHVDIDGIRTSFGLVKLTRISHTAAMAVQLPAGVSGHTLRVKICLHSNMPRLLRSWIETRLKSALTRKGNTPNQGLEAFCQDEDLLYLARASGCTNLQIVLISSPVVETGNDLDFEWGILDPTSTRSIIQSAGRIRRHRSARTAVNTHVLGRPLVAMQNGAIIAPGIETRNDKTLVPSPRLDSSERRLMVDLLGPSGLRQIDSSLMLDVARDVPLRDAEVNYCHEMISTREESPTGRYLLSLRSRMSLAVSDLRKFRRSTTRDLSYTLVGEDYETSDWHIDLAPGGRGSMLEPAAQKGLTFVDEVIEDLAMRGDFLDRAWQNYIEVHGGASRHQMMSLFEVRLADYGGKNLEVVPTVSLHSFTGLTRGSFDNLRLPFGKG